MVSGQYQNVGGIYSLHLQENGFWLRPSFFSTLERNFVHIICKFTVVGLCYPVLTLIFVRIYTFVDLILFRYSNVSCADPSGRAV